MQPKDSVGREPTNTPGGLPNDALDREPPPTIDVTPLHPDAGVRDAQRSQSALEPPFPEPPVPVRRSIPIMLPETPPTFTKIIVGAIVAVHLLGMVVGHEWLFLRAAKINEAILGYGEYYRLLSVMFLHAGIAHLFMNSYALWIIGRDVERFHGHVRFVAVYVLGGLTASVASLAMTEAPSVGASGAVFAIFAAEMVLLFRNRSLFGQGAQQRLRSLIMLLVLNAAIGIAGQSFIDNWAHLGGFIGGACVSWLVGPVYRVIRPLPGEEAANVEDSTPASRLWWVGAVWLIGLGAIVAWLTIGAA